MEFCGNAPPLARISNKNNQLMEEKGCPIGLRNSKVKHQTALSSRETEGLAAHQCDEAV